MPWQSRRRWRGPRSQGRRPLLGLF
jgi:hypothetical protein